MSDFDAWKPQEPEEDFARRVTDRIMEERTPTPKRRRIALGVGLALVAAAASFALIAGRPRAAHGEITAESRTQTKLGSRVVGVLEPGAHVKWDGDELVQDAGDVFYRVEPGGPLVVHTPEGDVHVLGTCFRVRVDMKKRDVGSAAIGAALSAAAFVAVYEGKVAVSHAAKSVELAPGEAARASNEGVEKVEGGASALPEQDEDPAMTANKNLADSVREYKHRLEAIEAQKTRLEKQLGEAQGKLAAQQSDGAFVHKSEFDLSADDWAQLSKEHRVKFRTPCNDSFNPSADALNTLGLAPQGASVLKDAWARSNQRVWASLKPLCAQAIGSAEVAEKIGPNTCIHLVVDLADKDDPNGTRQAFADVGEIRSGAKSMPEHPSNVLRMLMLMTGEMSNVESDLAKSLGPEDAHRIAFGDSKGLCLTSSNWGL